VRGARWWRSRQVCAGVRRCGAGGWRPRSIEPGEQLRVQAESSVGGCAGGGPRGGGSLA
jgi:hypothetical protein